jgi:hypothetical protein
MSKVPKKKAVSIHFTHAVFSLLDFLALEKGTNRLSQNLVWNYHSVLHSISEERRSHDGLAMQALVWLRMVQFGILWFGALYTNLR